MSRLNNKDGKPLFSVSGYGEARPAVANQVTEEDFKRNRRIDIRFTIRRPDGAQYEQVKERLEEAEAMRLPPAEFPVAGWSAQMLERWIVLTKRQPLWRRVSETMMPMSARAPNCIVWLKHCALMRCRRC